MSFSSSFDSISNFSFTNFYNEFDYSDSSKTTSSYLATENELKNSMTESAKNVFNLMDSILFDHVENTQFKSLEEECSNWKEHFLHLRITGHNYEGLGVPAKNTQEEVVEVIAMDGIVPIETTWVEECEYLRCDLLCSAQLEASISAGLSQILAWKVCELMKPFLLKFGKAAIDRRRHHNEVVQRQAVPQLNYRITNIPSNSKVGAEQLGHLKNCLKVTSKALHSISKEVVPTLPLGKTTLPSAKYPRFVPPKDDKIESISLQNGIVGRKIDTTGFSEHPANLLKNKSPEIEPPGTDFKDGCSPKSSNSLDHVRSEQNSQVLFTLKKKNLNFERITSAFHWQNIGKKDSKVKKVAKRPQTTFPTFKLSKQFEDTDVSTVLSITPREKNIRNEKVDSAK